MILAAAPTATSTRPAGLMLPPLPPFLRRHGLALLFAAQLVGCFFFHVQYRQRYVGAVDFYGYYQEGLLFKAGHITLPTELPAETFPAVVPLGFWVLDGGKVVPQYPPGYPLLIAAASVFGLEFYLMPLVGLRLLPDALPSDPGPDRRPRDRRALRRNLGIFFPIVVYGSTFIMSDLVAALFVLTSYWLYRRGEVFWSAFTLTFASACGPPTPFYCVVFAFVLLRDRRLIRYGPLHDSAWCHLRALQLLAVWRAVAHGLSGHQL